MVKKYYAPEIEEFHIGFEFEYFPVRGNWLLESSGKNWIEESFSASCGQDGESEINEIETSIKYNNVRVKHLDREDIESLGWFHDEDRYQFSYFSNGHDMDLILDNEKGGLSVDHDVSTLFQGKIKNKSELKRLLKQLGA